MLLDLPPVAGRTPIPFDATQGYIGKFTPDGNATTQTCPYPKAQILTITRSNTDDQRISCLFSHPRGCRLLLELIVRFAPGYLVRRCLHVCDPPPLLGGLGDWGSCSAEVEADRVVGGDARPRVGPTLAASRRSLTAVSWTSNLYGDISIVELWKSSILRTGDSRPSISLGFPVAAPPSSWSARFWL